MARRFAADAFGRRHMGLAAPLTRCAPKPIFLVPDDRRLQDEIERVRALSPKEARREQAN
jgi:hypothetical protein